MLIRSPSPITVHSNGEPLKKVVRIGDPFMVIYAVSVQVKPGCEDDFITATKFNHKEARKEKGNLRFDVLQSEEDPCKFMLYEIYRSDEAVRAHKETQHYKDWREKVAPWMARDRKGEKFLPLYPRAEEEW